MSVPTPAHEALEVFVGRWRANGTSYGDGQSADDPRASAVPWTSDESYAWLPGGLFLVHRWDALVGDQPFEGIEILGVDDEGHYFAELFDDSGNRVEYKVARAGDTWTFADAESRATATIEAPGEIAWNWEWRPSGDAWLPLCERSATLQPTSLGAVIGSGVA